MKPMNEAETMVESRRIYTALGKIESRLPDEVKTERLIEKIQVAEDTDGQVKTVRTELSAKVAAKKRAFSELNQLLKRVRAVVKGVYGDDSLEYESVGGKRMSEKKRPAKKGTAK